MTTNHRDNSRYTEKRSRRRIAILLLPGAVVLLGLGVMAARQDGAAPGRESKQAAVEDAADICPRTIGRAVPDVELLTPGGEAVNLHKLAAEQPTVLIFYRGGWCPYCTKHLGQLHTIEPELTELGYQIVAVSPDRPEKLRQSRDAGGFTYRLLSDADMTAAKDFGIAFRVDQSTRTRYKEYGIDLEEASGHDHHLLPVPAVFLIGPDGKIGFTYVNPDYKVRLDPEVLLAAAKSVLKMHEPGD